MISLDSAGEEMNFENDEDEHINHPIPMDFKKINEILDSSKFRSNIS